MLPQGGYEAICPLACSRALGTPTNGLDKPFPQLRPVQRGLDKLASHCCASFFLSSGFKAKLGQNHRIETPWWPDSIHTVQYGSKRAAPTADSLLPHPTMSAFAFRHGCLFLGLPRSPLALPVSISEFGSVARDPGAGCMFARMHVCKDAKRGVAERGICGVPGHMQASSEYYIAGCRDAGTMEKQKG